MLKVIPSKIFEYAATSKPILAGVSGSIKKFIKKEINNSFIFDPFDYISATEYLNTVDFNLKERKNFINKFSRDVISDFIIKDFLSLKNDK